MGTTNSGFLIQSTFGTMGNFELVVPSALGGLVHCWRNNDDPGRPWTGPQAFGSGDVLGLSLIQSNAAGAVHGPLELVARIGDRLAHYWREAESSLRWFGPFFFASGVSGSPALVQSRFGGQGNFELVVPRAAGGLAHYWRNNDDPARPWSAPTVFGTDAGQVDGVALLQSNLSLPGTLEAIATAGSGAARGLVHFWRDSGPAFAWNGPFPVPLGGLAPASPGVPGFIQSRHGRRGNFELVVPVRGGGLAHLSRDNDAPGRPWSAPTRFGSGDVDAVSLLQSTFGTPGLGLLEVAARLGRHTALYQRQDQPPFAWSGPTSPVCEETLCDPRTQGEWRVPFSAGVVGIHAALLHTGKFVVWEYESPVTLDSAVSVILDPESGDQRRQPLEKDILCAGNVFLPDGRLLVAGGTEDGLRALHTFRPAGAGGTWSFLRDLSEQRWYPTCTTLPDGRVFILSGTKSGGGRHAASSGRGSI